MNDLHVDGERLWRTLHQLAEIGAQKPVVSLGLR